MSYISGCPIYHISSRKQSAVASQVKTKVEWHIPNQEKFELVNQLLRESKVKHIKPVYTPKGGQ